MAWQRVALVVPGAEAEALADAFESGGAISTEIADAGAGTADEAAMFAEPGAEPSLWKRCRVSALFPVDANLDAAVTSAMFAAGVQAHDVSIDRVEDADWVAETQRQFAPIRAGVRLWIVPSWHEAPRDAIVVALDPGAAFGTGSHPTTRLCLAWLERSVGRDDVVLDYGCGSGILGIAALKLGAARAIGVDIDPVALESAGYNARRNDAPLELGIAALAGAHATITVANILANPLRVLAPLLCGHTAIGGRLALSGVLESQAAEVALAYAPWAALDVVSREEDWVLLAGNRRA
jgi:ribosomal protein L11 methyltransferase